MTTTETTESRVPAPLAEIKIFAEFCARIQETYDAISEYNEKVLGDKDSEWNGSKVLKLAKELASPENGNPDPTIKQVFDAWEKAVQAASVQRQKLIAATAELKGIQLSAVADKDPEKEEELKDKRKNAIALGLQLKNIAEMTQDKNLSSALESFLKEHEMPAVGRDQTYSFTEEKTSTPRYRVTVTVTDSEGNLRLKEDGFSKAANEASKLYPRGKGIKPETLREAWEGAGNSPEKTVKDPVEFTDELENTTLTYSIKKRQD